MLVKYTSKGSKIQIDFSLYKDPKSVLDTLYSIVELKVADGVEGEVAFKILNKLK